MSDVADALPRFFESPKVWTPEALALGIVEGVRQGTFGYAASATECDGSLEVSAPSAVRLREALTAESVGLGEGAALLRVELAERLRTPPADPGPPEPGPELGPGLGPSPPPLPRPSATDATGLRLAITATEDDLFALNQSLAKLRDLVPGGTLRLNVMVEARTGDGGAIDRVRAHNAVIEPLEEEDPDVEVRPEWLGGS